MRDTSTVPAHIEPAFIPQRAAQNRRQRGCRHSRGVIEKFLQFLLIAIEQISFSRSWMFLEEVLEMHGAVFDVARLILHAQTKDLLFDRRQREHLTIAKQREPEALAKDAPPRH